MKKNIKTKEKNLVSLIVASKTRFRCHTFHEPNLIQRIKYMKSLASESIVTWKRTLTAICSNGILPFISRSKKIASVRTACVIRSKKKLHMFTRPGLSIQKKFASIRTTRVIHSKEFASIRTARVIRSKQHCICSRDLGYPLKKNAPAHTAGELFSRWSVQKNIIQQFARLGLSVIHSQPLFICSEKKKLFIAV